MRKTTKTTSGSGLKNKGASLTQANTPNDTSSLILKSTKEFSKMNQDKNSKSSLNLNSGSSLSTPKKSKLKSLKGKLNFKRSASGQKQQQEETGNDSALM